MNEVGADDTLLSRTDVERLDTLLWRALKNQTLTRSKMGHQPRLYLRVEYETDAFHIGTLDDGVELVQETPDAELRNITDIILGIDDLIVDLETYAEHIDSVQVIADRHLTVEVDGETGGPETLVSALENAVGTESVTEIDPYGE